MSGAIIWIWLLSLALAVAALLTFALLILRRFAAELLAQRRARREQTLRHALFAVLDMDEEALRAMQDCPDLFPRQHRALVADLCLRIGLIIKGQEKRNLMRVLKKLGFDKYCTRELRATSPARRLRAAITLRLFDDRRSEDALRHALGDAAGDVVLAAADSLLVRRALPPLERLLDRLAARRLLQRHDCRKLLRAIAAQEPEALIRAAARDGLPLPQRLLLAEALGSAGHYGGLERLKHYARDPSPALRARALDALAELEHPDAGDIILAALADADWEAQSAALRAAGSVGIEEAAPRMRALMSADNWYVRFHAAQSLWELGDSGRRVLRQLARVPDQAGRMANLVLDEHGAAG